MKKVLFLSTIAIAILFTVNCSNTSDTSKQEENRLLFGYSSGSIFISQDTFKVREYFEVRYASTIDLKGSGIEILVYDSDFELIYRDTNTFTTSADYYDAEKIRIGLAGKYYGISTVDNTDTCKKDFYITE